MSKWKMNRAGLLNFWYYDDEIFHFADGKLLLRGSNGSGKSVTMQSFLPVLLDGRKSPDRLDPFGSKARRMEDYLLGEKEVVNRDERTGYLFIEFKREDIEQYVTIGIGLQAKRHKQMKFWGFVVTDNRRIGIDFDLYKMEQHAGKKQKIPRSRIELENVLADGGVVVQTQREYMSLVNKYVFGFETIEAYEDLIKLLIQLRSPKLSKDFKPTVIYDILEGALPPLSDEDLRHLSDTIEQMDQTKQQIEQLEREAEAITSLNKVYLTYNQRILADHAYEYKQSHQRFRKESKAYQELEKEKANLEEEITSLDKEINQLTIEQETYDKQRERLASHKVWNLEKERQEEQVKLQTETATLEKKENQLQDRQAKERKLDDEMRDLEVAISDQQEKLEDKLQDLDYDAEEVSFDQAHELNKQDFSRHSQEDFEFGIWKKEASDHLHQLEQIESDFQTFEALKSKYQEKDKELANEQKELDEIIYQEEEWAKLFEEDKEKKLNEIYKWLADNQWLEASDEALQEASRAVRSLYEPTTYESIKSLFRQIFFTYQQEQGKLLSKREVDLDLLVNEMQEKEEDLNRWKSKKDPEPPIDDQTKEARKQLAEQRIAFVPFYAAVEFQEHVTPETRKRIEAALKDSGILNALITSKHTDVKHDRILTPNPNMMAYTLADFLQPDLEQDSGIAASMVDEVLRSILVGEEETEAFSINEEGYYQIGLLKGHAIPVENVRYIGRNARRRYREEQIELLENEIVEINKRKQQINEAIQELNSLLSIAEQGMHHFPSDQDLQESFRQMETARFQIKQHNKRIQQLSDQLREMYRDYSKVKSKIDEKVRLFNIERSLSAYQEAIVAMKRYEKELFGLETSHLQYLHQIKRNKDITEQLDELMEEVDELRGDLNVARQQVESIRQNIKQIEHQLELQGAKDIHQQITEVQEKLRDITHSLRVKETTKPSKETERKHLIVDIQEKQKQVRFWDDMQQTWKQSFETEFHRDFIDIEKDQETLAIANQIVTSFGNLLQEKDGSKLLANLTSEFYKQLSNLMEYQMTSYDTPIETPDWMNESIDEEQLPHVEKWKSKSSRRMIELNYQGKQVSPYTVQEQIEKDQGRQESLLNEQDQALYEEILFHSVGQKLRARIRRAEQWVDQMKGLMESRDTSSGLSFSIKWKPKTAETEAEMDTNDLVHLLRQDPKLLKEEDLEKITIHFRSKIAKAKELMDGNTEMQTLLQVLKEVLDYRKWFSFVLSFQREGENKRELTNNQFYKFSGGEKAMAMYIPLFTACYSRYLEADDGAPYIISLDEAFAGVDENNIREMFEIVEQLGFDFMMNSQVLWGDYDTINALSICELVRPKNADFVSVIRYQWDGEKLDLETQMDTQNETLV